LCSGSFPATFIAQSAWPASWYAVSRRSSSFITIDLRSAPSMTLSLASFEVDHVELVVLAAHGEQRRLVHEVGEIGARHPGSATRERGDVHVVAHRLVAQVNFENPLAAAQVGRVDDDLPVEPTRAQQRRIEHVGTVRRGDEDDAFVALEAVHLHEQLVERLLALVVPAAQAGAAMATDRRRSRR
jgi:hypothetical protein